MKRVRVVAAVVRRDGRILVTRRHGHAERGGQWEFPGRQGRARRGGGRGPGAARSARSSTARSRWGELLARTTHRYPDLEVELAFFACALAPGSEPRLVGAAAMEWAEPGRLADLRLLRGRPARAPGAPGRRRSSDPRRGRRRHLRRGARARARAGGGRPGGRRRRLRCLAAASRPSPAGALG